MSAGSAKSQPKPDLLFPVSGRSEKRNAWPLEVWSPGKGTALITHTSAQPPLQLYPLLLASLWRPQGKHGLGVRQWPRRPPGRPSSPGKQAATLHLYPPLSAPAPVRGPCRGGFGSCRPGSWIFEKPWILWILRPPVSLVMVMVVNSALVRTHQSTYSGSFGPVLPPGWINYTRSVAVPLDVEGLTRPPLAAQCPLRRPGVGVVLLSHCWLWGKGGWGRGARTAPVLSILGPSGGLPRPPLRPPVPQPSPAHTRNGKSFDRFG